MSASNTIRKRRVLFVGAFLTAAQTKVRGGILFECQSLVNSPITKYVDWLLLDTTMESVPPPGLLRRAWLAGHRVVRLVAMLLFRLPDACLIYISDGAGFLEKGVMVLIARSFGRRVILRPVSGLILDDYRRSSMMRSFIRIVFRASSSVACQGSRWTEFVQSVAGLPPERTPLVLSPIEMEAYTNIDASAGNSDRALLIGWVERNKGIWDLLATVGQFAPQLEGMRFVICGYGREYDEFRRQISVRGLERFFEMRGWVSHEEKLTALEECGIYLMLSHREGLPCALLEAMAAGRAVIATSVGAVPDVVRDGDTGLLCEPKDIEDIGRLILQLRADPALRQHLGGRAQAEVVGRFKADLVWPAWRNLLCPAETVCKE